MIMARCSTMLGLVALTIIASPFAFGQDSGWYVGANVGRSKSRLDESQMTSSVLGGSYTATSVSEHDR
jgi:OmpA-OmpF porin, OOP family